MFFGSGFSFVNSRGWSGLSRCSGGEVAGVSAGYGGGVFDGWLRGEPDSPLFRGDVFLGDVDT